MSRLKRGLLMFTAGLAFVVLILLGWVFLTWDRSYADVPYPQLAASQDPQVIETGRYLVHGPAHCSSCHVGNLEESMRADAGEEIAMAGGFEFPIGPIAVLYTPNLTPDPETGIGRYRDDEIFRLLRHNVKPNGRASVAPLMPFANMADQDLVAIVSYLRSTTPIRRVVPPGRWTLLGKTIAAFLNPAAIQPVVGHAPRSAPPAQEPTVERGEYLANSVANCGGCHSPIDRTTGALTGPAFSGYSEGEPSMLDPTVILRAPNLTPDPTGVLLKFESEDAWVGRFRTGRVIAASIMDWGPVSRMHESDLRAIYRYFRSLPPTANDVGPTVERVDN